MRRRVAKPVATLAAALALCAPAACDRGQEPARTSATVPTDDRVEPSGPKPEYHFAAGLEADYPDVTDFLRQFMEVSLAGDYAGYRRLVARVADPESRARFEQILDSLRSLTIESIEEIALAQVPPPVYLVISKAEFLPDRKVALRRGANSRVAILVLEEEGQLRMMPAPSQLQPGEADTQPATAPATTGPSYPWQQDGDY